MKNEDVRNQMMAEGYDRVRRYNSEVIQENLETPYTGCDIFSCFTHDRFRQDSEV